MTTDTIDQAIYQAMYAALESRLHLIGSVITADANRETIAQNIRDKGDFYNALGYVLTPLKDGFTLNVGSNVAHEPYVLGGKVPSWTPIAPLISWVERKNLAWTDKDGNKLSIETMAYMIRAKIKREGIAPRNIFETIIKNREAWIYSQLDSLEVTL